MTPDNKSCWINYRIGSGVLNDAWSDFNPVRRLGRAQQIPSDSGRFAGISVRFIPAELLASAGKTRWTASPRRTHDVLPMSTIRL